MSDPHDISISDAVQLLLSRHELGTRCKQALERPVVPDISSHIQKIISPPPGDTFSRTIQHGLIGGGVGAAAGLGQSLFSKNRRHWLQRALTGALVGGGIGTGVGLARSGVETFNKPTTEQQGRAAERATANADAKKFEGENFLSQMLQPGRAGKTTATHLNNMDSAENQVPEGAKALRSALPVAATSAIGGGVGFAAGHGAEALRRKATSGFGAVRAGPELNTAMGHTHGVATPHGPGAVLQGARPGRPRAGFEPTHAQMAALRRANRGTQGKWLGRGGAVAGASLPILQALGVDLNPLHYFGQESSQP